MVVNPAREQLDRKNVFFPLSSFARDNLVSRDRFGCPVPHHAIYTKIYLEHVIRVELVNFLQYRPQIRGSGLCSNDELDSRQGLEALQLERVCFELFDTRRGYGRNLPRAPGGM